MTLYHQFLILRELLGKCLHRWGHMTLKSSRTWTRSIYLLYSWAHSMRWTKSKQIKRWRRRTETNQVNPWPFRKSTRCRCCWRTTAKAPPKTSKSPLNSTTTSLWASTSARDWKNIPHWSSCHQKTTFWSQMKNRMLWTPAPKIQTWQIMKPSSKSFKLVRMLNQNYIIQIIKKRKPSKEIILICILALHRTLSHRDMLLERGARASLRAGSRIVRLSKIKNTMIKSEKSYDTANLK